jgi:hypothetical protein
MKNLFGENMNNELFDKIEEAFVKEARLVQRLNSFMLEYNHFEYDEMGLNMEEADEVKVRLEKINKKLIANVNSILDVTLETKNIDILYHKIDLSTTIQEEQTDENDEIITVKKDIDFSIIVDNDGFELEIKKDNSDEEDTNSSNTTDNQ